MHMYNKAPSHDTGHGTGALRDERDDRVVTLYRVPEDLCTMSDINQYTDA